MTVLAVATLLLWLALVPWWARGMTRLPRLGATDPPEPETWTPLRVIVPARDEADGLEPALRSLLDQDHPDLRVVLVDDRSSDATPSVARRLAAEDPRLRVVRIDTLPEAWLGKTHACQRGAEVALERLGAEGDVDPWLLFTDADVRFAPGALRRATAYAEARGLGHLAALPRFDVSGPLLVSFVSAFSLLLSLVLRPWRVADANSDVGMSVGAFGLIRASAWRAAGEHRALALRTDDDLALGRAVKTAGVPSAVVTATELVAVPWYPDLAAAIRGLRKNALAGFGYSYARLAGGVAALLVTHVLPFVGLALWALPATRWLVPPGAALAWSGAALIAFAAYLVNRRLSGLSPAWALLHPVGVALVCWAFGAAAVRAARSGGVEWRGTVYPLAELRAAARDDRSPGERRDRNDRNERGGRPLSR